jgi:hypothetical protein
MSWQELNFYFLKFEQVWTIFLNMHWHSLQAFVDKPVSGHPNPHVE